MQLIYTIPIGYYFCKYNTVLVEYSSVRTFWALVTSTAWTISCWVTDSTVSPSSSSINLDKHKDTCTDEHTETHTHTRAHVHTHTHTHTHRHVDHTQIHLKYSIIINKMICGPMRPFSQCEDKHASSGYWCWPFDLDTVNICTTNSQSNANFIQHSSFQFWVSPDKWIYSRLKITAVNNDYQRINFASFWSCTCQKHLSAGLPVSLSVPWRQKMAFSFTTDCKTWQFLNKFCMFMDIINIVVNCIWNRRASLPVQRKAQRHL